MTPHETRLVQAMSSTRSFSTQNRKGIQRQKGLSSTLPYKRRFKRLFQGGIPYSKGNKQVQARNLQGFKKTYSYLFFIFYFF